MRNQEVMFSSKEQTWETPISFFNRLNEEFNFTLDVCALPNSAKCERYFTPETDGLSQDWSNEIVYMNPPYNNIYNWMEKAYYEAKNNGATVVCLIPARTDTKYWSRFCMCANEIRLVKGRLKFGDSNNSAPFPSAVIIFRPEYNNLYFTTMSSYINRPMVNMLYNKPVEMIIEDGLIEGIRFE